MFKYTYEIIKHLGIYVKRSISMCSPKGKIEFV